MPHKSREVGWIALKDLNSGNGRQMEVLYTVAVTRYVFYARQTSTGLLVSLVVLKTDA